MVKGILTSLSGRSRFILFIHFLEEEIRRGLKIFSVEEVEPLEEDSPELFRFFILFAVDSTGISIVG